MCLDRLHFAAKCDEKYNLSVATLCSRVAIGFLADRILKVVFMLQCCFRRRLSPSVVCTECIVAKRCVLEQKLLLTPYRKSYMRNRFVPK